MQECSHKVIEKGEIVIFDTDTVASYGYLRIDFSMENALVEGHKFNDDQKKLYSIAVEQINHNSELIKGFNLSFKEFLSKCYKLPEPYYGNRYDL